MVIWLLAKSCILSNARLPNCVTVRFGRSSLSLNVINWRFAFLTNFESIFCSAPIKSTKAFAHVRDLKYSSMNITAQWWSFTTARATLFSLEADQPIWIQLKCCHNAVLQIHWVKLSSVTIFNSADKRYVFPFFCPVMVGSRWNFENPQWRNHVNLWIE